MAKLFLLFLLLLVNYFLAMARENDRTKLPSSFAGLRHPPAPAPYKAEAPTIRKLGKHQPGRAPASSPFQDPETVKNIYSTGESPSPVAIDSNNGENVSVDGQAINLQKRHHSKDKSVAGGGVILGGLATTFLVAVFCYIRATGRHKSETHQNAPEITK